MNPIDPLTLDWVKGNGLIPAVVQDADTRAVLMVAWMNQEALVRTQTDGFATFYSRSRSALWRKGQTSGDTIAVTEIIADCDRDTLLILGRPTGPVCHTGTENCFGGISSTNALAFLQSLEGIIARRIRSGDDTSYTVQTYTRGSARMAQKVGEEGLEVALAAVQQDRDGLRNESADLLFHLLLLLHSQELSLSDVVDTLRDRHERRSAQ